jgi:hypothetical protein
MKMRRRVIIKVHLDAAAVEPYDGGHKWYTSACVALVQDNVDVPRLARIAVRHIVGSHHKWGGQPQGLAGLLREPVLLRYASWC